MLKNGVFWEYLENASELLAENSYLDSSWQDNSNDVWLSYPENHFDPFFGPHSRHSRTKFWVKIFFCFFSRIESFWCQKWKKKFFFHFCPLGVTPAGVIEFFWVKKFENFFFAFFSRIDSFWCQKSKKKLFLPIGGHPNRGDRIFWIKQFKKNFSPFSQIESFWCQIFICIDSRAC